MFILSTSHPHWTMFSSILFLFRTVLLSTFLSETGICDLLCELSPSLCGGLIAWMSLWSLSLVYFHSVFYFIFYSQSEEWYISGIWGIFYHFIFLSFMYYLNKTRLAYHYPTSWVKWESYCDQYCSLQFMWLSGKNGLYVRRKPQVLPSIHAFHPTVFSKLE